MIDKVMLQGWPSHMVVAHALFPRTSSEVVVEVRKEHAKGTQVEVRKEHQGNGAVDRADRHHDHSINDDEDDEAGVTDPLLPVY